MVKIPKFNELKKMGEGLASSAKGSKIFDKLKTSVDSLGAGGIADDDHGDAKTPLERCVKLIHELQEIKRMEANLFNNLKAELTQMAKDAAADSDEKSAEAQPKEAAAPTAAQEEAPKEPPAADPESPTGEEK